MSVAHWSAALFPPFGNAECFGFLPRRDGSGAPLQTDDSATDLTPFIFGVVWMKNVQRDHQQQQKRMFCDNGVTSGI